MAGKPQPIDESGIRGQIGARVRARRLKLKLSVAEAAERAGVPEPTWYHWEAGHSLKIDGLPTLAKALGCTMRSLLPPD